MKLTTITVLVFLMFCGIVGIKHSIESQNDFIIRQECAYEKDTIANGDLLYPTLIECNN